MNTIQKGEKAELILKDQVFQEALEAAKMRVFDELRRTGLDEKEKREDLYHLMRASDIFEGELKKYLADMVVEKQKLNKKVIKRII